MATQGVVSVVVGGKTVVKAVAGSDGYNAEPLAEVIRNRHLVSPEDVKAAAESVGFGHETDLVVQGPRVNLFDGDEALPDSYFDSRNFENPHFNPRWKNGTADHVVVVEFPA